MDWGPPRTPSITAAAGASRYVHRAYFLLTRLCSHWRQPLYLACPSFAQGIISAVDAASAFKQPAPFKPDVCLVNFYEGTGKLGYHQVRMPCVCGGSGGRGGEP